MKYALVLIGGIIASPAIASDLLYSPPPVHASRIIDSSGWYLAGHGGANFAQDFSGISFDTGYNLSGAVGYEFGHFGFANLRTEAEVGYFNSDLQLPAGFNGSVDAVYGFLNAYADFNLGMPLIPFIGGGVGYSDVDGEVKSGGFNLQASDSAFAYNLTAGVSYDLTQNIALDVAYRYLTIPDVTFNTPFGSVNDDVNNHQVNVGVRVKL